MYAAVTDVSSVLRCRRRLAQAMGAAASVRDRRAIRTHHDQVVESGAAAEPALARYGGQRIASSRRRKEVDGDGRGDRGRSVAVAGESERAVGQREDEAAVTDAVA